ncbi:hypothetical protein ABB37_09195 [Leptomonas pyrrhocoris]|uniref:Uncharacterized protein n=1 Tax=Leptomonas pyrrhocoris TaxID=157538 RepID=A0A0M9FRN6_LEPPY|nr:hypothetical protein ABB37_09195 [Leptomonas pyrrhocoris]XP_015652989.1 hypothetical protein ABB37_09195 [Leptomonas pyrrhocoris]KPA74549.1 hypothetical protein ABB37_09195 [Leptomonas pyrrhocoris]KPA74550.1 hypothetical protein ABB37_09195 [Leptomonas pyrrhocoris]|eukprot:XP_015652988.1 hypothetical protein ABB37_09195 [Leptomonas pyrrhocoris]
MMNALGDRCHSVLVLVDTTHLTAPLLDTACGYHVGCVLTSADADNAPSSKDITAHVTSFCSENTVACAVQKVTDEVARSLPMRGASATEHLTKPMTLFDATGVADVSLLISLLSWLYGEVNSGGSTPQKASAETPYTLVAVLDVSRGALCTPSSDYARTDAYAWLRPTPSYYSELLDAAKSQCATSTDGSCSVDFHCYVFPVQVYSRYPVVRDRGLQEGLYGGEATEVPVEQWTNKSTLNALLRELAFKAGQLAKYGA